MGHFYLPVTNFTCLKNEWFLIVNYFTCNSMCFFLMYIKNPRHLKYVLWYREKNPFHIYVFNAKNVPVLKLNL